MKIAKKKKKIFMIIFLSLKIKNSKMCETTSLSENFESNLTRI